MLHLARLAYCGAGAVIVMLSGCSGGGGTIAPPATGGAVHPDSVSKQFVPKRNPVDMIRSEFPLLATERSQRSPVKAFVNSVAHAKKPTTIAVADVANNVVNIYDSSGDQLAQLTGFSSPAGLTSDIKGDLFVADYGNGRIQVYAAGFQGAPTTLDDSGSNPQGVDSFNNGQFVAAANYLTANGGGPGDVAFFTNGQLTNTVYKSNIPVSTIWNCAFDAVGNLYVVGQNQNGTFVGEIVGGAQGSEISVLTTSNPIGFPGGIQVTTSGKIAVGDPTGNAVYVYNPPVNGSLGSPVSTARLTGSSFPVVFAFTKGMSSLYSGDFGNGTAEQYAFPHGGNALSTIEVGGLPFGIAVIPTQYPKVNK